MKEMIVANEIWGMLHVSRTNPTVLIGGVFIAEPADIISERRCFVATVDLGVENF